MRARQVRDVHTEKDDGGHEQRKLFCQKCLHAKRICAAGRSKGRKRSAGNAKMWRTQFKGSLLTRPAALIVAL